MTLIKKFLGDSYLNPFDGFLNDSYFDYTPKTNILKSDEGYEVLFSVPGLTKEDLKIIVKDRQLSISYEKEDENKNHRFIENFKKVYWVPDDVKESDIKGEVKDGILSVKLPFDKKKIVERVIELT